MEETVGWALGANGLFTVRSKTRREFMSFLVALDLGIASVGWAVVDSDTYDVIELGVNIFPEASAANNVSRRGFRQGKRLKRRLRTRLDDFTKLWQESGFEVPKSPIVNISELKVSALSERISKEQLFYVLYNALKQRGISYLEDAVDDEEAGSSTYAKGLQYNQKELLEKYPCQIQKERLDLYGKFHGQNEVTVGGEKVVISNVFTIAAYRSEVLHILETQQRFYMDITDEFVSSFIAIFNRKRKYYEGPGNEMSRTDYGIYTTKIDDETGEYITDKNLFEKLIGKCSVYPDELRAAGASYTAQEYNLLNDLNNLTVNARKLTTEEKKSIIEIIKSSDTINMRKIITKVIGESIEQMTGARIDKNEKEIFSTFTAYNKMRKALALIGVDIKDINREQLDEIGHILTINTDKESILEAFEESSLTLSKEVVECLISVRKSDSSLFSKWQSFSLKIMNELIPEMYEQPKEQMTLLTEMGLFGTKESEYIGLKYIPVDTNDDELMNPVVKRTVRIAYRVVNALLKKYGSPVAIVIEMPRDRNSDEEKKRINDSQKKNDQEKKTVEDKLKSLGVSLSKSDYSKQKNLSLKLKLWHEQDGRCLYSGRIINPQDIISHPEMFEIDHIIPRSISYDDSRTNKVLVFKEENQRKGNTTPYQYLKHAHSDWSFEQFKSYIIALSKKKEFGISRKKVQNLLFDKDITKIDVLQGFINRNLNDTRYASRVVLNTLQSFFKAGNKETKVKVINGNYTHQMRVNMKLDKNRDESFSHHAVDAVLIAYSQMGYQAYRKLQDSFIDFETGEILNASLWNTNMSDDIYQDYLYGMKWSEIRKGITEAEKKVKYWFAVDKKANRGLCNQTIRGTREYFGKKYKVNKFDIRTKEGAKVFAKMAFSDKERERLLVYKNDRKTFDDLIYIWNQYGGADVQNPFVQYEKETGDVVRKYAKNHHGPKIEKLKYIDGEVGACIDISHKYGYEKGSKKVILESLVPYRTDVYFNDNTKQYYLVGIKQSDVKFENGKQRIDEDAYTTVLLKERLITEGQSRNDLYELGYRFRFSLYKNDLVLYEKNGIEYVERFLSRTMPNDRNYIETKPIERAKFAEKKQNLIGLSKTTKIEKIRVDILGNRYRCLIEEFDDFC